MALRRERYLSAFQSLCYLQVPLVKTIPLSKLPPGSLTQLHIDGSAYALCNHEGTLRCFDGLCPHAGGPLGDGNLDGDQIVCPWHAWAFDCRTGANDFDPDIQLKSYAVIVKDESIFLDLT
jgi:nitrite reductase (NADH) small subunit